MKQVPFLYFGPRSRYHLYTWSPKVQQGLTYWMVVFCLGSWMRILDALWACWFCCQRVGRKLASSSPLSSKLKWFCNRNTEPTSCRVFVRNLIHPKELPLQDDRVLSISAFAYDASFCALGVVWPGFGKGLQRECCWGAAYDSCQESESPAPKLISGGLPNVPPGSSAPIATSLCRRPSFKGDRSHSQNNFVFFRILSRSLLQNTHSFAVLESS